MSFFNKERLASLTTLVLLASWALPARAQEGAIGSLSCTFALPPETPYYWEPECANATNGGLGCMADGVHPECRFCGEVPYTGIKCPSTDVVIPDVQVCRFEVDPPIDKYNLGLDVYYDLNCTEDLLGCKADGVHIGCRFCGGNDTYKTIPCPMARVESQCYFPLAPSAPYYWDEDCRMGLLGCRADGIHDKCRFCRARPYESIPCPSQVNVSEGACWFPNEPKISYYWDPRCRMGKLGCWADGIHAECRFCEAGPWANISCRHHLI